MTEPLKLMRHPADGRVHFSELKQHAKSPAHVKMACETAREMTRAMIVGGVADSIVFGQRGYTLYTGKTRRGAEWEDFKAEHPGQYLPIQSELDDAQGAAAAVLSDPVAAGLLSGCDYQTTPQWLAYGLPCAAGIKGERGGLDAIGDRYILDLKVTSSTDPEELARHAFRMHWHAQGVFYLSCTATPGPWNFYLLAVEAQPPHCVTILRLSDASRRHGERLLTLWTERHKQCEAAGQWPGYVQSIGELEPPDWMGEE
jgi:hypothetical protein